MKEMNGDLFTLAADKALVITTNGSIKKNGCAVLGRGCAAQAVDKWPDFPQKLGERLRPEAGGNVVNAFKYPGYKAVFTFPVKTNWWEKADIELIAASARRLRWLVDAHKIDEVYVPRPGCGAGKLEWKDVKHVLESFFDDRFIIVDF